MFMLFLSQTRNQIKVTAPGQAVIAIDSDSQVDEVEADRRPRVTPIIPTERSGSGGWAARTRRISQIAPVANSATSATAIESLVKMFRGSRV